MEIRTETKEQGSWSQYIDVGTIQTDSFGDEVFTRKGYPKDFTALKVERKYAGTGAARRCQWLITVPEGFPYVIRRVTNPGGQQRYQTYEVLYA